MSVLDDMAQRRAVREALRQAMDAETWVVVTLPADVERGIEQRVFEGLPVAFIPTRKGGERVVLQVAADATEQVILVERIARVDFRDSPAIAR